MLCHADYRFGNLLVDGDDIVAVLGWERGVPAPAEYGLARAELMLVDDALGEVDDARRERHRRAFYDGYSERRTVPVPSGPGFERRRLYRVGTLLLLMCAFDHVWDEHSLARRDREASSLRRRLRAEMG